MFDPREIAENNNCLIKSGLSSLNVLIFELIAALSKFKQISVSTLVLHVVVLRVIS